MEPIKNCSQFDRYGELRKLQKHVVREEVPNPIVLVRQKIRGLQKWDCEVNKNSRLINSHNGNVASLLSIGRPVGLAFGTLNIADFLSQEHGNSEILLQGYATCLVAFGEVYLTPEGEWNHRIMNGILEEGANHFKNSAKTFIREEMSELNIVSKCFTLRRNGMELWVSEPLVVGIMKSESSRVYSFEGGIGMFLRIYQYCLLRVEDRFYLIWRKNNVYFLFDCYGRMATGISDFERGTVALICVCDVKKIDILVTCLGEASAESIYTLYELKMLRLLPCCDEPLVGTGLGRQFDYEIISNDHARLVSSYHIATNCFKEHRYKQAFAVGLISIIYSKINAPCTWDTSIVDKILIMGNRCYETWTEFNKQNCLHIHDIPRKVIVGQFMAEIVIFESVSCGHWISLSDYQACEITRAIRHFLEELKCSNILVQVDRKVFSIWKRNGFYYIFDPYSKALIHSTKTNGEKHATLQMLNSLRLLCCVFTQDIIGISLPCKFAIYVVKILNVCKVNIQNIPDEAPASCVNPAIRIDIEETQSLNESIYDSTCENALACSKERYDVGYCDLDIPPLSETQNLSESEKAKGGKFSSNEEEELEEEEEEEKEEEEKEDEESQEDSESEEIAKTAKKSMVSQLSQRKAKGKRSQAFTEESDQSSQWSDENKQRRNDKDNEGKRTKRQGKGNRKHVAEEPQQNRHSKQKKGKEKRPKENNNKGKEKKRVDKTQSSDEDTISEGPDSDDGKAVRKVNTLQRANHKENKGNHEKPNSEQKKNRKDVVPNKSRRDKEKKDKSRRIHTEKNHEREQTSEDDIAEKIGTEKDKQNDKRNEIFVKEQSNTKDYKGKKKQKVRDEIKEKKGGDIETSFDGSLTSVEETSFIGISSKSTIFSEVVHGLDEEPRKVEQLRKYDDSPPEKKPEGEWPKGSGCLPNRYPGYTPIPYGLAVVGSETGTYQSLCQLIRSGLQVATRILTMTAWGNYVVFKNKASFLLYDGCTCNPCRFQYIDLSIGTAGLLCFDNMHDIIVQILKGKDCSTIDKSRPLTVEDICNEYC